MLDKVLATIRRHSLLERGDSALVAVSGGPDSVALLHLLLEAGPTLELRLAVAHLDHGLRGAESAGDLAFVEGLARRLCLPFVSDRVDVGALSRRERLSLEDAGRMARRRFLAGAAARFGASRVALGHHQDDLAETVLLRLIAGAGRSGLSGMRPTSEGLFIRPLIECSRAEILEYLASRGIDSREDASNRDLRFPRNRLRHEVIPILRREINPRLSEAIGRTSEILREEDIYLDKTARRWLERLGVDTDSPEVPGAARGPAAAERGAAEPVSLDATRLSRLAAPISRRVIRLALRRAGLRGRDLARTRIDEILALAKRRGQNASLSIGGSLDARIEYGVLRLDRASDEPDSAKRARRTAQGAPLEAASGAAEAAARAAGRGAEKTTSPAACGGAEKTASLAADRGAKKAAAQAAGRGAARAASPAAGGGAAELSPSASCSEIPGSDGPTAKTLSVPGEARMDELGLRISARLAPRRDVEDEYRRSPSTRAYCDASEIAFPLTVRRPRPGDRFRPLGAPGTRKLSDLWTDLKVPRGERRRAVVVECGGRVVWVPGIRVAHRFRVTARTGTVAILEAAPLGTERDPEREAAPLRTERDPGREAAPRAAALAEPSASRAVDAAARAPQRPHPPASWPFDPGEGRVLYTAPQIADAVDRLASEIDAWAGEREILVLGILHGSFVFVADLVRRLRSPVRIGFVDRQGRLLARGPRVAGATTLLIEDILDTGESLSLVSGRVSALRPAEVRTCVLFDKPGGRKVSIVPDFVGLAVPERWVVGYGLDHEGLHRNLPYLTYV